MINFDMHRNQCLFRELLLFKHLCQLKSKQEENNSIDVQPAHIVRIEKNPVKCSKLLVNKLFPQNWNLWIFKQIIVFPKSWVDMLAKVTYFFIHMLLFMSPLVSIKHDKLCVPSKVYLLPFAYVRLLFLRSKRKRSFFPFTFALCDDIKSTCKPAATLEKALNNLSKSQLIKYIFCLCLSFWMLLTQFSGSVFVISKSLTTAW